MHLLAGGVSRLLALTSWASFPCSVAGFSEPYLMKVPAVIDAHGVILLPAPRQLGSAGLAGDEDERATTAEGAGFASEEEGVRNHGGWWPFR